MRIDILFFYFLLLLLLDIIIHYRYLVYVYKFIEERKKWII